MSNRNNDVFSVLVTSEDASLLTAGAALDTLAPGQLAFVNADTEEVFDGTVTALPRNFYIALGVGTDTAPTILNDIRKSAGQFIPRRGVSDITFKAHTAGQPMIVNVGGYSTQCDTDYGIRVEFRNSRINRIQGYNQFSKAYVVRTECCDGCAEGCDSHDSNLLSIRMVNEINADTANLVLAEIVARQAVTIATHGTSADYAPGAVMTEADVQALVTFNLTAADADKVYTDIRLTAIPLSINSFCQVNLGYHKLLETTLIVSLIEGFNCSGSTVVSQYPVFEEGSFNNIMQKEYHASGWAKSGPYKLSQVTGTAKGDIEFLAQKGESYNQFIAQYAQTSESGWLEYSNPLSTIIAIPVADTTTSGEVAALLNLLFEDLQFDSLVDEEANATVDPTVVEPEVPSVDEDGIA
jgi:hypothetical protein